MSTHRVLRTLVVVLAATALTACAPSGPGEGRSTPPAESSAASTSYACGGERIDAEAYAAGLRADSADDDTRAAILSAVDDLGEAARPADLGAWIVVESTSTRISLLRPYDEPVDGRGIGVMDDHDSRVFELLDALPSSGESGWMVARSGPCALSLDPAPLAPVIVQIDGSAPPDAGSPSLPLLVTEWACNSGRDAAGRVRLISLDETDDTVSIRVGVEPEDGAQTCPSNPTTSFVVDLASPLGDREVVDGSLVTPRPLPTGFPVVID